MVATSTSCSLGVSPSPATTGAAVTLTATVAPAAAAGSVQFTDGGGAFGAAVAVSGGVASMTSSALTAGSHSLQANFTPTTPASYSASSSAVATLQVSPAVTSTALAAAPVTSHVGDTVVFTVTLTPSGAVGAVQLIADAVAAGPVTAVAAGSASISLSTLTVGPHNVTAVFTPTTPNNFAGSTSPTVAVTVNPVPAATTTALAVSPAGAPQGQQVTLSAQMSPAAAGQVQFTDGGAALGAPVPASVGSGTVTMTTAALAQGTHSLRASFTPTSSAYTSSVSPVVSVTVTQPVAATVTAVALAASPTPGVTGSTSAVTATLTPAGATGTVQFTDNGVALGPRQPIAGGAATIAVGNFPAATHSLQATFAPTDPALWAPSSSSVLSYPVNAGTVPLFTTVTLSAVPPVGTGASPQTFTATLSPAAATGTVRFSDGPASLGPAQGVVAGSSALTVTLAVGSHPLAVAYTPDVTGYAASASPTLAYIVADTPGMPVVTTLTQSVYDQLPEIYHLADSDQPDGPNAYPLLRFLTCVGDIAQPMDYLYARMAYLAPSDGGPAVGFGSTSDLVDPATADAAWLPWLAQVVGMHLDTSLSVAAQRDSIAGASTGRQAGTRAAIVAAASTGLIGSRFCQVMDHTTVVMGSPAPGGQWDITLITRSDETPDVPAVLAAVVAAGAKPAGVLLHHAVYTSSWAKLTLAYPTWAAIRAAGSWAKYEGGV